MKVYFADTGYYIALLVPQDRAHVTAVRFAADAEIAAVTTDYVLLELAAYFAKPPLRNNLIALVEQLRQVRELTIVRADPALFDRGWEHYCRYQDKGWSLTDCISFLVMQEQRIQDALTPDHHYEQAGFRALLKETEP